MKKKLLSAVLVLLCIAVCALKATANDGFVNVIAMGRGNNEKEALDNAIEEAVRQQIGSMLFSREELENNTLREKVILVSRGKIKDTEIMDREQKDGLTVLTVKVQINPDEIRESVLNIAEGTGVGSVEIRKRPFLERGQNAIRTFFEHIDMLKLLDVVIEKTETDLEKSQLDMTVRLALKENVFEKEFASPLTEILNEFMLADELNTELAEAEDALRHSATFFILRPNTSFSGWSLPKSFLEAIQKGMGMAVFGKTPLRTNRRVWLHILLCDKDSREITRLPIPFPITNILLFSNLGNDLVNPWALIEATKPISQPKATILFAPLWGTASGNGYTYLPGSFTENFELRLPCEILLQVKNINLKVSVE